MPLIKLPEETIKLINNLFEKQEKARERETDAYTFNWELGKLIASIADGFRNYASTDPNQHLKETDTTGKQYTKEQLRAMVEGFKNRESTDPYQRIKDKDTTNHPPHYGGADNAYEAIKVIEAWGVGFNLGNVLKYISRAGKKDASTTVEDLKKAQWYLEREVQRLEGNN